MTKFKEDVFTEDLEYSGRDDDEFDITSNERMMMVSKAGLNKSYYRDC